MPDRPTGMAATPPARVKRKRPPPGPVKRLWRSVRRPLAESRLAKNAVASLIAAGMRFVRGTNRYVRGSTDIAAHMARVGPAIYVMWHGQHLMGPALMPRGADVVAMVSRSADAEINALTVEKFGLEIVRGSGGRDRRRTVEKGGVRALIALKKALDAGRSVFMIADIPHGRPRDAGLGVITLARISGRPIVPVALATSRRKVIEKSWDKTTIHLPFGRMAVLMDEPITVEPTATDDELETVRHALTAVLDDVNARAYALVDAAA